MIRYILTMTAVRLLVALVVFFLVHNLVEFEDEQLRTLFAFLAGAAAGAIDYRSPSKGLNK